MAVKNHNPTDPARHDQLPTADSHITEPNPAGKCLVARFAIKSCRSIRRHCPFLLKITTTADQT